MVKEVNRKSEEYSVTFPGLQEGRTATVLCLPKELVLINLSWLLPSVVTRAKSGQLYAHKSRVGMAPLLLFLILFCGKCNAEMINCQEAQFAYCLGSGEIGMPKFKL